MKRRRRYPPPVDAAIAVPRLRARLVLHAPVTLALAAASVAVFAWLLARGPITTAALVDAGALERGRVWSGEAWRLVTAAFVHGAWPHLALNVAALLVAGPMLEAALGRWRFLGLYLASAVAGSALSLVGQDAVAAGASGGIFGAIGALLALHLREVGSWRAFARSPAARAVLAGLAASWLLAVLWPGTRDTDHLAHVGGLLAGSAGAWVPGRPRARRVRAASALALALSVLVAAAVWPRDAPTRFESDELVAALHAALRAEDVRGARALVARADARGIRSATIEYYRALLLVQEGDAEGAAALLEHLGAEAEPPLRAEVRARTAAVEKMLGYRYYSGDGRPKDPARGLAYFEAACRAGDEESCRYGDAIAGRGPFPERR
jgi:rhomboid protease GluP